MSRFTVVEGDVTVVASRAIVSTVNSSETELGIGATFTGTFEEVLNYADVVLTVKADVASAADGLVVEWSIDGSTVIDDDKFTIAAGAGKQYSFGVMAKFMRVRYVNGGTAQASFSLSTLLKPSHGKSSSHRIGGQIVDEDDAELIKAIIAAKKTDGGYTNVSVDAEGRMNVVTSSIPAGSTTGIAAGQLTSGFLGIKAIRQTTYTEQTANAQRSIVSNNANDAAAGTGARTVEITYYTATLTGPFTETVTLNGTTAVNTVATNICFIEKIKVLTAGSTGASVGVISLMTTTGGGGTAIWSIAAVEVQTRGAHHYVADGKTCSITSFTGGLVGVTATAGVVVKSATPLMVNSVEYEVSDHLRIQEGNLSIRNFGSPIEVDGPARITSYVIPDVSQSITYFASFDFFEQNTV